jgi:hypothetical protein
MASASMMPPPPVPGTDDGAPQAPTSPPAASPSPAQPSPATDAVTKLIIDTIQNHRAIAKALPAASPYIAQINDLMRKVGLVAAQGAQPGEAAAPPV